MNKVMAYLMMSIIVSGIMIIPAVSAFSLADMFRELFSTHSPCYTHVDCLYGEYCYNKMCQSRKDIDEFCTEDIQCRSGLCYAGECSAGYSEYDPGTTTTSTVIDGPYSPYVPPEDGLDDSYVEPEKYCFDYCFDKGYGGGECSIFGPGNCGEIGGECNAEVIEKGYFSGLGFLDCNVLTKCWCYGDGPIENNEQPITTSVRTSTICKAACFRSGFWQGGCGTNAPLIIDIFNGVVIGGKGEFGCSAGDVCSCWDSQDDEELAIVNEKLYSPINGSKPSLEEMRNSDTEDDVDSVTDLRRELGKQNQRTDTDWFWDFFMTYWRSMVLIIVILLIVMKIPSLNIGIGKK